MNEDQEIIEYAKFLHLFGVEEWDGYAKSLQDYGYVFNEYNLSADAVDFSNALEIGGLVTGWERFDEMQESFEAFKSYMTNPRTDSSRESDYDLFIKGNASDMWVEASKLLTFNEMAGFSPQNIYLIHALLNAYGNEDKAGEIYDSVHEVFFKRVYANEKCCSDALKEATKPGSNLSLAPLIYIDLLVERKKLKPTVTKILKKLEEKAGK